MSTSSNPKPFQPPRLGRGVSLIEALVAVAVMAFGMLGVVGLQTTLRANADLSKQRSEATRIAQEKMEQWRNYSVLTIPDCSVAPPPAKAFDCKTNFSETVPGYTTNTAYTVAGTITPSGVATHKTMVVEVSWDDRNGDRQSLRSLSALARISPALAATAVAPPGGSSGMRGPGGRSRGIPPQAKNFGDGTSGFRPPQTASGTVAWLFDNVTGLIQICATSVTDNSLIVARSDLTGCGPASNQLLSGYVRFVGSSAQPTPAQVTAPTDAIPVSDAPLVQVQVVQTAPTTGTIACFEEVATDRTYVLYFCAIPVASPALAWSGRHRLDPSWPTIAPDLASNSAALAKVCRYNRALTGLEPSPLFANINAPLTNENLVLIRAGNGATAFTCPNPPTREHQPAT
jgi:Tfp pilus assembly protein PilV